MKKPQTELTDRLFQALEDGDLDEVRRCLDLGCPPDSPQRSNGLTPLDVACEQGFVEGARLLLEAGALPNGNPKKGNTPSCPLYHAVASESLALVDLLLGRGASPDGNPGFSDTPLQLALSAPPVFAERLLGAGANPNAQDGAALMGAIEKRKPDWVEKLIQAGADPNLPTRSGPLLTAAWMGQREVVCRLLEAGANPKAKDDGLTSVEWALVSGHAAVVREMMVRGVNPSRKLLPFVRALVFEEPSALREELGQLPDLASPLPCVNRSPLSLAAGLGLDWAVAILVEAGAPLNEPPFPLVQAARNGKLSTFHRLFELGADPWCGRGRSAPIPWTQHCLLGDLGHLGDELGESMHLTYLGALVYTYDGYRDALRDQFAPELLEVLLGWTPGTVLKHP